MKIGKMWLICIILWWIEIGMKNPNPPSTALFSFLRLSLKRQKSNYLHLFLRACLHGGVEPPGGWGNSPSCVRKIARVFFFFFFYSKGEALEIESTKKRKDARFHSKISCAHIVIIHFLFCLWIEQFGSHLSSVAKCGNRLSSYSLVNHPLQCG